MAIPFSCMCGQIGRVGWVGGASFLRSDLLVQYTPSPHIIELLAERDGRKGTLRHKAPKWGLQSA